MKTQDIVTGPDEGSQRKILGSGIFKSTINNRTNKIRLKRTRKTLRNTPQRRK